MSQKIEYAVILASAAILGVIITQVATLIISFQDKKHQREEFQRKKYEEMMFEFQSSLKYVQEVNNCKTLEQLYQLSGSPQAGKAYCLAQLYFPSLVEPLGKYIESQILLLVASKNYGL